MKLDELDQRIVALLRADARLSFRALAERTGSTTPTVASRVRRLEAAGVLRGYHADVAPPERTTTWVLTLRARPADAAAVARDYGAPDGVAATILEGGSVVLHAHLADEDLQALTAELAGDDRLLGFERARVLGETPAAGGDVEDAAVACHLCGGPVTGSGVHRHLGGRRHVFCCGHCARTMEERYAALGGEGA